MIKVKYIVFETRCSGCNTVRII